MNFRPRSRGGPTRAIVKWTRRGALLSLLLFSGCAVMTVEQNPGNRAEAYFTAHDPQHRKPQYRTLASDGVTLGYATVGEPGRPVVLFVHGTPGRWGDFVHFLTDPRLQRDAYLVSLDRPGWGDSPFAQTPRRVTLALQSRSLGPLLERLADASAGCGVVLVGHSLGGSLVARMAMDYPQWVSGLVILAGSIDPQLGKPRWYNTLASVPPIRWLTPDILAHANTEIMPLHADLREMQSRWEQVRVPVTYIQGGVDRLVSPANVAFARAVLRPEQLRVIEVADEGHFLLWDRPQLVSEAIADTLARGRRDACTSSQWAGQPTHADAATAPAQP